MMTVGTRLTRMVVPTMSGRPPKRRRQKAWLMTATGSGASARSSAGVMNRPSDGRTPSAEK